MILRDFIRKVAYDPRADEQTKEEARYLLQQLNQDDLKIVDIRYAVIGIEEISDFHEVESNVYNYFKPLLNLVEDKIYKRIAKERKVAQINLDD